MKSNISINTDDHFPYLGNGIQFNEHLFGLEFDANLIQQTSELIWQPNSTLPYSTLKKLPAPYNILSDIALEMTVHNNSKTGLIGKNALFNEVKWYARTNARAVCCVRDAIAAANSEFVNLPTSSIPKVGSELFKSLSIFA